jgi:hypothetical protein
MSTSNSNVVFILSSFSILVQDCRFLVFAAVGYCMVEVGSWLQIFWDNLLFPSSRINQS